MYLPASSYKLSSRERADCSKNVVFPDFLQCAIILQEVTKRTPGLVSIALMELLRNAFSIKHTLPKRLSRNAFAHFTIAL